MNALSSIALSGLSAAALRLDLSGHNIANAQTPGYRRQIVLQGEREGGGVDTALARAPDQGSDLAQDIVEQMSATYAFKASVKLIGTQDHLLGTLLDLHA